MSYFDHQPSMTSNDTDRVEVDDRRIIAEPARIVMFDPDDELWLVRYDDERTEWVARYQIGPKAGDAPEPCATHATEHRVRDTLPCPWCVIDELKRNRDSATPPDAVDDDHVCGVCEGTQRDVCNCKATQPSGLDVPILRNCLGNLFVAIQRYGVPTEDIGFAMREAAQALGPPYSTATKGVGQ